MFFFITIFCMNYFRFLYIYISVVWVEIVLKSWCFGISFDAGLLYIFLFSLPIAGVFTLLCLPFSLKANKVVFVIVLAALGVWFSAQAIYFNVFGTVLLPDKIALAGDAFSSYWRDALDGFISTLPVVILTFLPLIIFFLLHIFAKREITVARFFVTSFERCERRWLNMLIILVVVFTTHVAAVFAVWVSDGGIFSASAVYTTAWTPELSMRNFGNLTTQRLNVEQLMFGEDYTPTFNDYSTQVELNDIVSSSDSSSASSSNDSDSMSEEVVEYEANILSIDFDALVAVEENETIREAHQYFSQKEPTLQNEYTGMFEGKNLIFITAEAFWQYSVHEEYTPTLYKLANEGFVFENFYNPLWWSSTTDGEFVATNGLYALNFTQAFYETHDNYMPYTMGNIMGQEGYATTAYHNHYYDYYDRHLTHTNMGYDFFAIGMGLEVTESWPESDLEMMELTIPTILEGAYPFHSYYMTVSGHMNYSFLGNAMSSKNYDAVSDLQMSDEAKAYIACNIELDKALEYILDELEKAGELENTVICLSSDHHPYGLSDEALAEFQGDYDSFDLQKSTLILWSGDMEEPVVVEKVAASVDILPTLLNLFGLDYDSRLLMGNDLLSDTPGLVLFSNQSFMTDEGRYDSMTDNWIADADSDKDMSYAQAVYSEIQEMLVYNELVIIDDYYSYIYPE